MTSKCLRQLTFGFGIASLTLGAFPAQAQDVFVFGKVRIEFLSPSLVRIEQKGPKGFEDRETFNIIRSGWPGGNATKATEDHGTNTVLSTKFLQVSVIEKPESLADVTVFDPAGNTLYHWDGKSPAPAYLPAPTAPQQYVVADFPRIVPPPWGATPALPKTNPFPATSGWDLGNQAPDIYIFNEPNPEALYKDYINLTGPTEMPDKFLFGFWNSRYEPYSDAMARGEIEEYRRLKIPLDLFVLDTNWRVGGSHGYQVETKLFPDMKGFMDFAHQRGIKIMMNDHPEPIGPATSPQELNYRWQGLDSQFQNGLDVWWFDRNWGTHLGTPVDGLPLEVWGMRVYHDMTAKAHPLLRPMIMTNVSGIDGGYWDYAPVAAAHRYPIWWTGDTPSTFGSLQRAVANAVNSGIETMTPYVSDDLGGHIGDPDPELYTRFLEYGALAPVDRVHCTYEKTRVPWAYGAEAEATVRRYINLRYRLQPVFYEASHRNYETGFPLLRRLDLYFAEAPQSALSSEYLIGHDLLVAPVMETQKPHGALMTGDVFVGGGLKGEYFASTDLTGPAIVTRQDPNVDFDWNAQAPDPKLDQSKFSAKWTGQIRPTTASGKYTFSVEADDGVRLFINGKKLIDKFGPQDDVTNTASIDLQQGQTYSIELDYNQLGGNALCHLRWTTPDAKAPSPSRSVWIPDGNWTDLWSGQTIQGPKTVDVPAPLGVCPLFTRANSLILTAPEMSYTDQKPWSPITIEDYAFEPGNTESTLYEDDGRTTGYKSGQFTTTQIQGENLENSVRLKINARKGSYFKDLANRSWLVRVHLPKGKHAVMANIQVDGKKARAQLLASATASIIPLQGGNVPDGPEGGDVIVIEVPKGPAGNAHFIQVPLQR